MKKKLQEKDLNPRPRGYEPRELTTALSCHVPAVAGDTKEVFYERRLVENSSVTDIVTDEFSTKRLS